MITIGIDAGMENVRAVVLDGRNLLGYAVISIETNSVSNVVAKCIEKVCIKSAIDKTALAGIGITGGSAEYASGFNEFFRTSAALAKGVEWVSPEIRTVIDIGSESFMVMNCANGRSRKVERNDVCAAGTGRYLSKVAQILGMNIAEAGEIIGIDEQKDSVVGTVCAVFAETEIISLVHAKIPTENILLGVYNGVVSRILPLLTKIKLEEKIAFTGGVAKNKGMIQVMEKRLKKKILVPQNPDIIGAIGAGLLMQEKLKGVLK